jgi:multidrug efflux pump subunit AcrB
MWLVKIALNRPYTFIVLGLLVLLGGVAAMRRTPADIFPQINIPVVSVAWTYTGLNPEDLEARVTTPFEKVLTTLVDNIEHLESTTYNGVAVVKIFLQPGASLDTANAQTVAASEAVQRFLPPGITPPLIINFSASTVPVLQFGLSGKGLSEQQLNDIALNFVRPQMVTVPGTVIGLPFGGKPRQVMINLDQNALQSMGITPSDVLNAVNAENLILPAGTAKLGESELDVRVNTAPRSIAGLADLPIRQLGARTIYLRDVATVSDGSALQSNMVRQNGHRGVLISILKAGNASTLSVVKNVIKLLPRIAAIVPPELEMAQLGDQSVFVQSAIDDVVREIIVAAALTGLLILLFIGSWRSTVIIAISIPLSVLSSVMALSLLHETINIMTLGGLALAVGVLVDDATVAIENINRILEEDPKADLRQAILTGSQQIAVPAFVSTLCICIVFLPLFLLEGVARYLFVPLAEAVVFAMLASYLLSRTLVPTLAMYLLASDQLQSTAKNFWGRQQRLFEHGFESIRDHYRRLLVVFIARRKVLVPVFLGLCLGAFLLVPWLGQNFFPDVDSGQFILHVRGQTGLRIEETARLCDQVEASIREQIPAAELHNILDNIGLPYSPLNTMHMNSGTLGVYDADIMVALSPHHHRTADYVRRLRQRLPREFPGATFYFLPADIVTQILNFGLPAPIDVQFEGSDVETNKELADRLMARLRGVSGLTDLRVQQPMNYPTIEVAVDRTKAAQAGFSEQDVAGNVLNTLSGSFQVTPMFFVNWKNGVTYNLVAETPQYGIQSVQDLENIPVSSTHEPNQEILGDVAVVKRSREMACVSHYNIRRVIDIYGSVQDRDLGAVSGAVEHLVADAQKSLPRGTFIRVRGQIQSMRSSYEGLISGLGLAMILIYLLVVINFQSWLDPFIIITALPAVLAGTILALFFSHTTLSVPALMGALMCLGVATANSILVVSFAKAKLLEHSDATRAALEAGATRFRPVVMTALAMMVGMTPVALGLGAGGDQNAPLGRAVIGGLACATLATLFFVPAVFSLLHGGRSQTKNSRTSI